MKLLERDMFEGTPHLRNFPLLSFQFKISPLEDRNTESEKKELTHYQEWTSSVKTRRTEWYNFVIVRHRHSRLGTRNTFRRCLLSQFWHPTIKQFHFYNLCMRTNKIRCTAIRKRERYAAKSTKFSPQNFEVSVGFLWKLYFRWAGNYRNVITLDSMFCRLFQCSTTSNNFFFQF